MLSFFPQGVLDEILNLIESVSEDFPSYSWDSFVYILNIFIPTIFVSVAHKEKVSVSHKI